MNDRARQQEDRTASAPGEPGPAPGGPDAASASLLSLGHPRRHLTVAALCLALGFGLVTTVRTTAAPEGLRTAREGDLVAILDSLTAENDRLSAEVDRLESVKARLATSGGQADVALDEARREAEALAILAGTARATGPGVVLTITDPAHTLESDVLLDAVEELRDAGGEAIEIGPSGSSVRVVAQTAITAGPENGVKVGDSVLTAPYRIAAIGDPQTLAAAMAIPGGVVATVERAGGSVAISQSQYVEVSALRAITAPRYARPTPDHGHGG